MSKSLRTSALAAGLTAMWIGAVAPAEAGTVVVPASVTFTATGTVKLGVDSADLFGGGDLTGLPYVATYVFQTAPSTVAPYYCCAITSTGHFGMVSSLNPASASTINVSATITTNGDTFALSGNGNIANSVFFAFGGSPSEDQRSIGVSGTSSGGNPGIFGHVGASYTQPLAWRSWRDRYLPKQHGDRHDRLRSSQRILCKLGDLCFLKCLFDLKFRHCHHGRFRPWALDMGHGAARLCGPRLYGLAWVARDRWSSQLRQRHDNIAVALAGE